MTRDFFYLFAFIKGQKPESIVYENSKIIDDVIVYDENNLADSIIVFEFQSFDTMAKYMDISDEQFYDLRGYPYYHYHDNDDESYYYDFKEGYITFYYYFNDENKKIFKEIYKKLTGLDFNDEIYNDDNKEFTDLLYTAFESLTLDIINDFTYSMNKAKRAQMTEQINEDLEELLKKGIEVDLESQTIKIKAGDLLNAFIENSLIGSSYGEALKIIFRDSFTFSPFYEQYLENDKFFDFEAFNRGASSDLESILEGIEENPNLEEKIKNRDEILSKFKMYVNTKMPSNPKYEVKIMEYKVLDDKITFYISGEKGSKQITTSPENFLNLMYNPTLFELEQIYK